MKKGLSGILTLAIGILLILAGCSAPEPTEIKLEGTVPILDLKETSALTVLLTPENADSEQLEFCTDDEKVATFSRAEEEDTLSGIVTGVSEGKTSIYVKYKDQIISNKIEITVEDKAKKAAMEKEAKEVTKKINDIGTVTLDSKKAIEEARKAYDSMSKEAKPLVKNLKVLTDAEKAYDELKKKSDQAKGVENVINQIGEVTLDSEEARLAEEANLVEEQISHPEEEELHYNTIQRYLWTEVTPGCYYLLDMYHDAPLTVVGEYCKATDRLYLNPDIDMKEFERVGMP